MVEILIKLLLVARSKLRSRARLEAENIVLRQQVIVLSRKARTRQRLRNINQLILVWMYRLFPSILHAITVIKPETAAGVNRTERSVAVANQVTRRFVPGKRVRHRSAA